MAQYRYLFGNWQTAAIDVEIPLYGVYITDRLGDTGYMQGSFSLDQTGLDNDLLVESTIPGKSFVIVLRDNRIIWGGYITSRTYQSQAKGVQMYAKAFDAYTDSIIAPMKEFYPSGKLFWPSDDQAVQFYTLLADFVIDEVEAGPLFPLKFDDAFLPDQTTTDVVLTGIVRNALEIYRYDYKSYRAYIDEMANGQDGFDWKIVPQFIIGNNQLSDIGPYVIVPDSIQVQKVVKFGYPYFHANDPVGLTFDYPGNILNYYRTDNLDGVGTTTIGVGSGEGEEMLFREISYPSLIDGQGDYFPMEVVVPMKDITDQGLLNDRTGQESVKRRPPKRTYKVTIRPDMLDSFGTDFLGSQAMLSIRDALHPSGSQVTVRINEYALSPPSEEGGSEEISLGFVGDFE